MKTAVRFMLAGRFNLCQREGKGRLKKAQTLKTGIESTESYNNTWYALHTLSHIYVRTSKNMTCKQESKIFQA